MRVGAEVIAQRIPSNSLKPSQNVRLINWIASHEKRPGATETMDWIREKFRRRLDRDDCEQIIDSVANEFVKAESKVLPLSSAYAYGLLVHSLTTYTARSGTSW